MSTPARRSLPEGPVILDVSFLIALQGESAAQAHAGVLPRAVASAITLGQVHTALAQRAGITPAAIEEGLRALGTTLVDFPLAAAAHIPAAYAAETAHRAAQEARGEQESALGLGELGVLAHAAATGLPVLTTNSHQVALARRLDIDIHHYDTP